MPFIKPGSTGGGFFGTGAGGTPTPPTPSASTLDTVVQADTRSSVLMGFSGARLNDNYSGYTWRWYRASDAATKDFSFDASTWCEDITGITVWLGSSDGWPILWYDQLGSGKTLSLQGSGTAACKNSNGIRRTSRPLNNQTLGLQDCYTKGGVRPDYSGGYYLSCPSSGLPGGPIEFHFMGGMQNRFVASNNTTDPSGIGALKTAQNIFSYGGNGNGFRLQLNESTSLWNIARTASLQYTTLSSVCVSKDACSVVSVKLTTSETSLFMDGFRQSTVTPNATNISQLASMGNGEIRIGKANSGYANENTTTGAFWFGALVVTNALDDSTTQRTLIHARLEAIAYSDSLVDVPAMMSMIGSTGAVLRWMDADSVGHTLTDYNGNLTYNINTIGSPSFTYSQPVPYMGLLGLKTSSGANTDDHFDATNNFFCTNYEGTAISIHWRETGGTLTGDVMDGTSYNGQNERPGWSLWFGGYHHSQPNAGLKWASTKASSPDATAHFYPGTGGDGDVGKLSQSMLKYLFNLNHGDTLDSQTITSTVTISDFTTGTQTTFTSGQVLTWALVTAACGVIPPTPETRTYPANGSAVKYPYDNGTLHFQALTFKPPVGFDPTKSETANMPYVKQATNYSYVGSVGSPIGHHDSGIASQVGNGNIRFPDPTAKLGACFYLNSFQGVRLMQILIPSALTQTQIEMFKTSWYRFFSEGYSAPNYRITEDGNRRVTEDGVPIALEAGD